MVSKTRRSDYKAPGGKLVRVSIVEDSDRIERVEITGDFFLLPEDELPRLEKMLVGSPLERDAVKRVVYDFFITTGSQGLGVTRDDFVNAIVSSARGEEN